jgi:hypothetical protein
MKSILPILAGLAVLVSASFGRAQQPSGNAETHSAAGDASSISPESLVDRVLVAVDTQDSIAAKVRHRVELMGRPALIGTGIYLQQGSGAQRMFRLELMLRTSLFASSVEHVCDGNQLWIFEELGGNKNLAVVDMSRLERARPKSHGPPQPPGSLLTLAGLPKLLRGLQDAFVFSSVVESRLDDLRVLSIAGGWHPARLTQMLPDQKPTIESGGGVDLSKLASNLPDRVVLHVGFDDLFPYRIEYWRSEPDVDHKDAAPRAKLIVVMELYEVQLGAAIDPARFAFRPGNIVPQDRTKEFLERLGLEDPPPEEAKRRLRSQL